MKRTVSTILAVLMLAFCLASCAGTDANAIAPEGMELASGEGSAYYLFVPESWELTQGYGTWGAYTSDASNVNVSTFTASDIGNKESESTADTTDAAVHTEAPSDTEAAPSDKTAREQYIDAYWDMCWKTYMNELNGFSVVEDGKQTTLGGYEAKQYVYTAKYEGVEYKMQMTVTYSGGLMYILTYTAKTANYDSHLTEVAKIVSEFKFK